MNAHATSPRELVRELEATTLAVITLDHAPIRRAMEAANDERQGLLKRLLR
jgi:hypothetical protein